MVSARAGEPDRYLAALLAPRAARDGLLALAAFSAELGRIGHLVRREPLMGEIRLQWWRDALDLADGPAGGDSRTGNPIADALRDARTRHALPGPLLRGMIDAHASDLQAEPFADEDKLDAYFAGSEGAQFALAAQILGAAPGPEMEAASASAGTAYGLTRLLLGLPYALSQGRLPLPQGRLARAGLSPQQPVAEAGQVEIAALMADLGGDVRRNLAISRQRVAELPRPVRVAYLPLALVGPYLRALERPGRNALRQAAEVAPLQRIWRIAAAHWLGRL